jgi:uncharacterized membrane protein YozB (DUF420 family)
MDMLIPPQANVAFQVLILATLFASIAFKLKRRFFLHGATVLIALVMNTVSFLLVMLPSLMNKEIFRTQSVFTPFYSVTLAHAVLGAIAEILAVWLVASWHLQSSTRNCVRKRKVMDMTLVLWILALLLGILLYAYLNVF